METQSLKTPLTWNSFQCMNQGHGLVSNLQGTTGTSKNSLCTFQKNIKICTTKLLKITCLDYVGMNHQQQTSVRTKSGRLVKKPERYVPVEKVEDDYATDEHDTDDETSDSGSESEEEEEDIEDSDSEGSLVDFVVPDESESESE